MNYLEKKTRTFNYKYSNEILKWIINRNTCNEKNKIIK